MTKEDIALGMLALHHAKVRIKAADDELRRQARELWRRKESVPVEIEGEIVGTVGRSAPKKQARISDGAAFLTWMRQHYPERVETLPYIEDMDKAIAVLEEHAPELVQYRDQVDEHTTKTLIAASEKLGVAVGPGGEADVPGITVDNPEGTVAVHPDKGNAYLIEQMFTEGRVSLDGTVRKEIEGGQR